MLLPGQLITGLETERYRDEEGEVGENRNERSGELHVVGSVMFNPVSDSFGLVS